MTLRARLLVALVGVVAAGLAISAVVTYVQLRSFLVGRLDPQLQVASISVTRELFVTNRTLFPQATGRFPAGGTSAGRPPFPRPAGVGNPGTTRAELVPTGTVGEFVRQNGAVRGKPVAFAYGGKVPAAPTLPHPLPTATAAIFFTASSPGPSSVTYRVMLQPLGRDALVVVVGIPLTDVNATLRDLLLVEIFVSLAVLVGLGSLSWWIVRRDLRPLEEMATTAGAIAGGDLALRVAPAEERTEVGRLGLALNAMLGEIEEAFAARAASEARLRRFLADASHELRTPLTSIRGYAEIFDLGARERPADLETAMHHIRDEALRMNVLVDDLLLLAQLDQQRPLERRPVDLAAIVGAALDAARVAAPGIEITYEGPATCSVPGDDGRLRQVMDNLLGNAVRHTPPGTTTAVRVLRQPETGSVLAEVRDHGPGIPAAEAQRIFEPFYRADFGRARTTGGAGLGLAIVAAIVHAHGGVVGVRPAEGGGACFWFLLPAGPTEGDPPAPPEEPAGHAAAVGPTIVPGAANPQEVDSFN